ncbi:MAG: phosphohistidine phosphatase SixA [Ktedonobacterales bacterium]
MNLYLLRHGIAGDRDEWTRDDHERPLTEAGRQEMLAIASGIRWLDLNLDTLVTSPLTRARETADFIAQAVHPAHYESSDLLAPGCDLRALAKLLAGYPQSKEFMIVGHQPDLGEIIAELLTAGMPARVQMKKAACCCVKLADGSSGLSGSKLAGKGQLVWHLPPQILARLG